MLLGRRQIGTGEGPERVVAWWSVVGLVDKVGNCTDVIWWMMMWLFGES